MQHIEHKHQVALIHWSRHVQLAEAADVKPGSKIADYLLAIPNGGRRDQREAVRLKAEGVKPGVSDLLLPLRRGGGGCGGPAASACSACTSAGNCGTACP